MSAFVRMSGTIRPAALLAASLLAITAGGAVSAAGDEPTLPPVEASASPSAGASPGASSPGAASAEPSPMEAIYLPLPEDGITVPPDIETVSLTPTSEPGMVDGVPIVVGTPIHFGLGHCGLLSPVDVDGSLWQAVGGLDASGGAIDTDEEIGELINATAGELTLVDENSAEFLTSSGQIIAFERAPDALDYPLCM